MHLILDGVGTTPSKEDLLELLSVLPGEIGMHIVGKPRIYAEDNTNPGISGLVMIEESHIAVHTYSV